MNGGGEPIRFRGGPLSLTAMLPGAGALEPGRVRLAQPALQATVEGSPKAVEPLVAHAGDLVQLHFPRSTPPGTYHASLHLGDEERDVVVEVEPEVFLRIFPERWTVTAQPGEEVDTIVSISNLGNVPVQLDRSYGFGIYDVGGLDCAVGRVAVGYDRKREHAADSLAEALFEMHGGLARLHVRAGSGSIVPGASLAVGIALTVPDRVQRGHTYWGTWPLLNVRYYVRINVPDQRDSNGETPR